MKRQKRHHSAPPTRETPVNHPARKPGKNQQDTVWVRDGGHVYPITVSTGLTDGFMTEVRGEDLKEGLEVVVGKKQQQVDDQTASPFTPQTMRSNRPQNREQ